MTHVHASSEVDWCYGSDFVCLRWVRWWWWHNDEQHTLIWCWTAAYKHNTRKEAGNTAKRWAESIICGPASIHRVRRNHDNVLESMRCHRDCNRAEKLCLYLPNALHTHTQLNNRKSPIWDLITLLLQSHQVLEMQFIFRHKAIRSEKKLRSLMHFSNIFGEGLTLFSNK